jgi:hypothetical protein
MNNQLRKIVGQAVSAIDIVTGNEALDDELAKMYIPDCFAEKFAELIIQECIDKITTYDLVPGHSAKWEDIYDIHARLLQDLGEELKEHFGVEE